MSTTVDVSMGAVSTTRPNNAVAAFDLKKLDKQLRHMPLLDTSEHPRVENVSETEECSRDSMMFMIDAQVETVIGMVADAVKRSDERHVETMETLQRMSEQIGAIHDNMRMLMQYVVSLNDLVEMLEKRCRKPKEVIQEEETKKKKECSFVDDTYPLE